MENRVVQTVVKESPNPITMDDLLKESLRFHPDVIIPAEMRGAEALTAIEAGRTGHTIITTLHANSALDAYNRILSMCSSAGVNLTETKILELIVEVFKEHNSYSATIFLEHVIKAFKFPIKCVQTDNGAKAFACVVCERRCHGFSKYNSRRENSSSRHSLST